MNKDHILSEIKNYIGILIGIIIYAFAVTAFLVPSGLISAGFGGIGTIVYIITQKAGFGIPVGVTYFVLNLIVLIIAYKVMGWKFVKVSIFGVVAMSLVLIVLQKYITKPIVPNDPFMNAIIGGALGGFGLGITFNSGGNTGGTDIISLIINKYKDISPGKVSLYCNALIIAAIYLVFKDLSSVVYGFVVMWVTSYTLDVILNGYRQSYQFMIMSSKYQLIADAVLHDIHRGVTVLDGEGWFSKKESKVILVITSRNDKNKLLRTIKRIDPDAFLSVSRIDDAFGKNFDRIKS